MIDKYPKLPVVDRLQKDSQSGYQTTSFFNRLIRSIRPARIIRFARLIRPARLIRSVRLTHLIALMGLLGVLVLSYPSSVAAETAPNILSSSDRTIYKKSFQAVRDKKFKLAKQLIKTTDDPILRSAVLAQVYTHPNYKSSINELSSWLKQYKDQGMATNIYRLALRKRGKKRIGLTAPELPELPFRVMDAESKKRFLVKEANKDKKNAIDDDEFATSKLERQVRQLRRLVRRKQISQARAVARKNATSYNIKNNSELVDRMYAITISGYYFSQRYSDAVRLAGEADGKLKTASIESSWWGGLSAWQKKDYDKAAGFFATTSKSRDAFLQSAAYFWKGRVLASQGKENLALKELKQAVKNPTTFYGQIALKYVADGGKISNKDVLTESPRKPNGRVLSRLAQIPVMKRGFALLNVDEPELAMLEWRYMLNKLNKSYSKNLLALADDYQLHHTGLRLAIHLQKTADVYYGRALFPVFVHNDKDLKPDDAAIALAIARQESHFFPYAISRAGAVGLMQMMPATANMVSRWSTFKDLSSHYANKKRPSRYDLFKPELNFVMGTRYLASLLADDFNGNLIFAVAGYNGGPSNVRKWAKRKNIYGNDPLLFIESIPLRETRLYVTRVIANYWVYNHILELDNPTLDQIVDNRWPKKFIGK